MGVQTLFENTTKQRAGVMEALNGNLEYHPSHRGRSRGRKWATERKGYPVKDVAAAGGWKTEEVLVTLYQQADAETIKNVVLHPTHRIVSR